MWELYSFGRVPYPRVVSVCDKREHEGGESEREI